MEELLVYGHTREYTLGEQVMLKNHGILHGETVMIIGGKAKGKYHKYNNYYTVRAYVGDRVTPYDFKVLEWDLE